MPELKDTEQVVTKPVEEQGAPVTKPVEGEPKPEVKPATISRDVAQARINRMYARLQDEKSKRIASDNNYSNLKDKIKVNDDDDDDTDGETKPAKGLSRAEAEAIWDRKENQRKFTESETKVLMRHPNALNDDGTFNLKDSFAQSYINLGRENTNLAFMVNGPELAEAMAEKKLGLDYKRGAADGARHTTNANNAHTGASTVAVSATTVAQLPDVKKRIARRMGLTEAQYTEYEGKIAKGDKKVR